MVDYLDLIWTITPFIFGLIAIALIPGKEKILEGKVKTYRVEILLVVYIIALLILAYGFRDFMFLFVETPDGNLLDILNGMLLTIIALGIMGVNYRNHSIFSKSGAKTSLEERIDSPEMQPVEAEVAEVATERTSPADRNRIQPPLTIQQQEFQMVGCPQCGNAIKVNVTNRPVKMSCPNCGIEGMVQ